MREDDLRASSNIEDRRGMGGGMSTMTKGGLGIGGLLIVGLISMVTGIDPRVLMGGAQVAQQVTHAGPTAAQVQGRAGAPTDQTGTFVAKVLGETEDVWTQVLPQQAGVQYTKPTLVLFSGATQSGCGAAQSAMGPFYCPLDKKLYLDTSFFQDMQRRLGGGGDFAYAYVIAHEVGHHVENLIGILPKVQRAQARADKRTSNALSVKTELMADCFAGVWAYHMNQRHNNLDENDMRQAVATATAIGDDRLQQQAGRGVAMPDSFTHGSSEQRVQWLIRGMRSGQMKSCDTFNGAAQTAASEERAF